MNTRTISMLYMMILHSLDVQAATITDGPGKYQGDVAYSFDVREFTDQLYEVSRNNTEVLVGSRQQRWTSNTLSRPPIIREIHSSVLLANSRMEINK